MPLNKSGTANNIKEHTVKEAVVGTSANVIPKIGFPVIYKFFP